MTARWILILTFAAVAFVAGRAFGPAPVPEPEVVVKASPTPGWHEVHFRGKLASEFTAEELLGDAALLIAPTPQAEPQDNLLAQAGLQRH